MRRAKCGSSPDGSGYVKPNDPVKAAEIERAYQDALKARAVYDNFWTQKPAAEYDPNGSNAQHGWPAATIDHFEQARVVCEEKYAKWQDAWIDPIEFTGIADMETRTVSIVFDVSGGTCGEVKIQEESIAFDEGDLDIIELID
jgi:hypothetical protein